MKCVNRVLRVGLVAALLAVGTSAPATAAIITFDGAAAPSLFADAVALTNQFAGVGITFGGRGAVLNAGSSFGVTGVSAPNFLAYRDGLTIDFSGSRTISRAFDTLSFSTPINALSFLVGSGAGISAGDMFQARAFQGMMLLDTRNLTLGAAVQTVLFAGPAITRVEYGIVNARTFDGFVVDNLNFTPVPEPVTMLLLGSGLAGLVLRRARRPRA